MLKHRKIITQANYAAHHTHDDSGRMLIGEVYTKPSKTIPGQQISLQELLKRYVRGQEVQQFNGVYLGEDEMVPDNLERMTEIERKEAAATIREAIENERQKPRPQKPEPVPAPLPAPAPQDPTKEPAPK